MIERRDQEGIRTLTLVRPEKRNALDLAGLGKLAAEIAAAGTDPGVRVLVLTGTGTVFCSGLDLGSMGETPREPMLERVLIDDVLTPLANLPIPSIAAMNGHAYAGGLELALHCDIRIAVASARMAMPVARLGIVVPYPLLQKLVEVVGSAVTAELLFSGAAIESERALVVGLVNHVVRAERLWSETEEMATAIAANAPLAIRAMKLALIASRSVRERTPSAAVKKAFDTARGSADAEEGLRAVAEKRAPRFSGR